MSANNHGNFSGNRSSNTDAPVLLAERFTRSEKFRELFAYGMDLVEETAAFLDNEGREKTKDLPDQAKALYGTESMRLTTRLMQLASWLLLQRAVAEGEMTAEQAIVEKKNVRLNQLNSPISEDGWSELPEQFVDLVYRSVKLQNRIKRLDQEIYPSGDDKKASRANPVAAQQNLLETAFDPRFNP